MEGNFDNPLSNQGGSDTSSDFEKMMASLGDDLATPLEKQHAGPENYNIESVDKVINQLAAAKEAGDVQAQLALKPKIAEAKKTLQDLQRQRFDAPNIQAALVKLAEETERIERLTS